MLPPPGAAETILDQIEKEELDKRVVHNLKKGDAFKYYSERYTGLETLRPRFDGQLLQITQFHYLAGLNDPIFKSVYPNQLGRARCFSACSQLVAVAGSQLAVLALERSDAPSSTTPLVLRAEKFAGAVTAMDLAPATQDLLVVGFEQGQLAFFDVQRQNLLKACTEAHKNRVLQVRVLQAGADFGNFNNNGTTTNSTGGGLSETPQISAAVQGALVVSSDEAGFTVMTRFKKVMLFYSVESTLLLKQQEFPITTMQLLDEPVKRRRLRFQEGATDFGSHQDKQQALSERDCLLAMANVVQTWIVKINLDTDIVQFLKVISSAQDLVREAITTASQVEMFSSVGWGEGCPPPSFGVGGGGNVAAYQNASNNNYNPQQQEPQLLLMCSWNQFFQCIVIRRRSSGAPFQGGSRDSLVAMTTAANNARGYNQPPRLQSQIVYPTTSSFLQSQEQQQKNWNSGGGGNFLSSSVSTQSSGGGRTLSWNQPATQQQGETPKLDSPRKKNAEDSVEDSNVNSNGSLLVENNNNVQERPQQQQQQQQQQWEFEMSPLFQTSSSSSIICVAFVSESLVFIVDRNFTLSLIHTSDLQCPTLQSSEQDAPLGNQGIPSLQVLRHVCYPMDMQPNSLISQPFMVKKPQQQQQLQNQQILQQQQQQTKMSSQLQQQKLITVQMYGNSFAHFPDEHTMYFLCHDRIGIAALASWESVLTQLIGQKQWLQAMYFLLQVVEGKYKFLGFDFNASYYYYPDNNNGEGLLQQQQQQPPSPFQTPDKSLLSYPGSGYGQSSAPQQPLLQQPLENQYMKETIDENAKIIATKYIHEVMKQLMAKYAQKSQKVQSSSLQSSDQQQQTEKLKQQQQQQQQSSHGDKQRQGPPAVSTGERDEQKEERREAITRVMEFLVRLKKNEILFQDVHKLLGAYLQEEADVFYECLEPFVLTGQLASSPVPDKAFFEAVAHFKKHKNYAMVEALVTTLPLDAYDTTMLMTQCMEKGLIKALIHICTKGREEVFIAPLSKLWGHYVFNKDERPAEALYFGLRALWYVRLSLRRQMVNGGRLSEEKFVALVKQFGEFFFYEQNLREMLLLSPQACFEVLFQFFEGDTALILNQAQDLRIKLPPQASLEHDWLQQEHRKMDEALLMVLACYQDVLARQDGQAQSDPNPNPNPKSSPNSNPNPNPKNSPNPNPNSPQRRGTEFVEQLRSEFYIFLAKLIQVGNFKINKEKIVETAFFLLENKRALDSLKMDEEMKRFRGWPRKDEVSDVLKGEFIYKLLTLIEKDLIAEEVRELRMKAEDSPYTEISRILAHREKDYQKCLELYLRQDNRLIKDRMFGWLWDTLAQLENAGEKSETEAVTAAVVKLLPEILRVNSEKARDLISRFLKRAEKDIVVAQLGDSPDLQLEYIEHVLKDRNEDGKKIDNEVLTAYIKLLCQKRPRAVLHELVAWDYPLDEALRICREYNVLDATAYLLERTGATDQALDMYMQILTNDFAQYRQLLLKSACRQGDSSSGQKRKQIKKKSQAERDKNNGDHDEEQEEESKKNKKNTDFNNDNEEEEQYEEEDSQKQDLYDQSLRAAGDYDYEEGLFKSKSNNNAKGDQDNEDAKKNDNDDNYDDNDMFVDRQQPSPPLTQSDARSSSLPAAFSSSSSTSELELQKIAQDIRRHVESAIDVCLKSNKFENIVDMWFRLLDDMLAIGLKQIDREDKDQKRLSQVFAESVGKVIEEIAKSIDINELVDRLKEKYTQLYLGELKETFIRIIANYLHIENILVNANELIKESLIEFTMSQDRHVKKGVFARPVCDNCDQLINQCEQKQIIIFACGHIFHLYCASYNMSKNDNLCPACMRNQVNAYFHIMLRSKSKTQQLMQTSQQSSSSLNNNSANLKQIYNNSNSLLQLQANSSSSSQLDLIDSNSNVNNSNSKVTDMQKIIIVNLEKPAKLDLVQRDANRQFRLQQFDEFKNQKDFTVKKTPSANLIKDTNNKSKTGNKKKQNDKNKIL